MKDSSKKLSTEPYKGVRDFYPEDMAVQNYIFDIWKKTAQSFGYEEYGASILEPANLYLAKSGQELVNEQTYTFTDRGDREVTIRPEMTPSVARMVAARKRELALPLRWFSIPNLFRYEQPQRGRLREHWQLNADIFGLEGIEAEIEIISLAYRIMKKFGAQDSDFEIRINDRRQLQAEVEKRLKNKDSYPDAARLLDKKEKMPEGEFQKKWQELSNEPFDNISANDSVKQIIGALEKTGIKDMKFWPTLARGFDYYTGIVFEIFDTNPENRRALFGGGRYDELTALFGGDPVPAVGFGMGDVTMRDFLETHKLLPELKSATKLHICTLDAKYITQAQEIASRLREKGLTVSVNLTNKKVGDQITWADKHHIPFIICIGDEEIGSGKVRLKNLETGKETEIMIDRIYEDL